jgi:hypothetical protein
MSVDTFHIAINDQGNFLNGCSKVISQTPVLDLAYLSNTVGDSEVDLVINLNPVCLLWCDFYNLFFTSGSGNFWINPGGANSCAITFNQQTYESTQKKCILFNLVEQVKKAWSIKNSKLETAIPAKDVLILNKEAFYYSSLASSRYATGLSLDQVISTLLSNNQIVPADSTHSATVKFIISYKFYFRPLDITVLVNFAFITKIPCFKNNEACDFCPYTNADQNCRPCFEVKDDNTIASFLNDYQGNLEEYNYEGNAATVLSENSSHYLTNILDSETAVKSKAASTVISDSSSSTW